MFLITYSAQLCKAISLLHYHQLVGKVLKSRILEKKIARFEELLANKMHHYRLYISAIFALIRLVLIGMEQ
jgi:hypothetical protein